jgi:hypothetical protein
MSRNVLRILSAVVISISTSASSVGQSAKTGFELQTAEQKRHPRTNPGKGLHSKTSKKNAMPDRQPFAPYPCLFYMC